MNPMVYDAASDRYQPIAWDEAFAIIAKHLNAQPDPNQAIFYTSGRASNEAAFLYQLFVREYGTNNFPTAPTCATSPVVPPCASSWVWARGRWSWLILKGRCHFHLRPEPRHQPPAHVG